MINKKFSCHYFINILHYFQCPIFQSTPNPQHSNKLFKTVIKHSIKLPESTLFPAISISEHAIFSSQLDNMATKLLFIHHTITTQHYSPIIIKTNVTSISFHNAIATFKPGKPFKKLFKQRGNKLNF